MSNFTFIAIVVTSLFVSVVLIIDHIEVARTNRVLTRDLYTKREGIHTQTFGDYCNEIGLDGDCSTEELVAASEDWSRITKILKTV